jgi:hypothetical protein
LNTILILKTSSTFGEWILNFVKMETKNLSLINTSNKKYAFIFLNYILPILFDLLSKLFKNRLNKFEKYNDIYRLALACIDIVYKFKYIFDSKWVHSNFIEHFLKLMIVNQGSKDTLSDKYLNMGKQLNLFFLFMAMRLGEWYYNKDNYREQSIKEILPPKKKPLSNNICPLCKGELKNPTALKCCGIVHCDVCISSYYKRTNKCPNCNSLIREHLVKIFR